MKKGLLILLIAGVGLGLVYAYKKYQLRTNTISSGQQAADFSLKSLSDDSLLKLSDYKGQLVLLNFWASWCPPCKKEIPGFIKVQAAFKDKPFTIIGVSLEDKEATKSYVKKMKINYPVTYGEDEGYEIQRRSYGATAIPLNVLISPDQKIISKHLELTESELTQLIYAQLKK